VYPQREEGGVQTQKKTSARLLTVQESNKCKNIRGKVVPINKGIRGQATLLLGSIGEEKKKKSKTPFY